MKYLTHRATVYVVLRDDSVCGVFGDLAEADKYREDCEREFFERTGKKMYYRVQLSTYYE